MLSEGVESLAWQRTVVSDDWLKSNLAAQGGSLKSKPMWRNTKGVLPHRFFCALV
jgi:hypothetical protein